MLVINKINARGTGYTVEEINTHNHYCIYEYTVYVNGKIIERSTCMSIIDAIKESTGSITSALGIRHQ